jgi:hypothetical protein
MTYLIESTEDEDTTSKDPVCHLRNVPSHG